MGARMKRRNPPMVHEYIDRHEKVRFYLRRRGFPKVPLPGLLWSREFMAAYEAALAGQSTKIELGASRTVAGTLNAALVSYYHRARSRTLRKAPSRCAALFWSASATSMGIAMLRREHVQALANKKTPSAARNFKKALRGLVDHCLSLNMIAVDPTVGLKLQKMKSHGHHTWIDDEIAQYKAHHPPGSKPRLALALLLQTGHARADVVRMGRQHVRNGKLSMRRQKTRVPFEIPLLPDLLAELQLQPKTEQLAFLTTEHGKPFTAAGFGNKFRQWCNEANLPHCSAHGLRKSVAVRLAMNGATAPELMAWFGWKTIGEAQRYTEQANRIKLAESAGAKIISGTGIGSPVDPVSQITDQPIEKTGSEK
jgi:integrase